MTDYIITSPRRVSALYDYPAENPHELPFREGEIIEVLNTFGNSAGWWYGKRENKFGIFPSNYCAPAEQRKLKKRAEKASMFVKRMQMELGFVKTNTAKQVEPTDESPDAAEDNQAYQKMIFEMKDYIESLSAKIADLEAGNQNGDMERLTAELDDSLKREEDAFGVIAAQQKQIGELEAQQDSVMEKLTTQLAETVRKEDEMFAIISEQRGKIEELEASKQMLRDEIELLSAKLGASPTKDGSSKDEHKITLEEKLTTQLNEAFKNLSEYEEEIQQLHATIEKLNTQLEDALHQEEQAYSLVVEQQNVIAAHEEARQKKAVMFQKVAEQIDECFDLTAATPDKEIETPEEKQRNKVKELTAQIAEHETSNQKQRVMLDKLTAQVKEHETSTILQHKLISDLNTQIEAARKKEEEAYVVITEMQKKRHSQLTDSEIAAPKVDVKRLPRQTLSTSSMVFYIILGLALGYFLSLLHGC